MWSEKAVGCKDILSECQVAMLLPTNSGAGGGGTDSENWKILAYFINWIFLATEAQEFKNLAEYFDFKKKKKVTNSLIQKFSHNNVKKN